LGGNGADYGIGIAIDAAGNAYVAGHTLSSNFPTTLGAFRTTNGGGWDVFVTKLNPLGTGQVYSTYLGGSGNDFDGNGNGPGNIAVDASGNLYVTGTTGSTDFPTANAIQSTFRGGTYDAYVTKLNPTGSGLVYSTYLGGSGTEAGQAITLDALPIPNAYVTGATPSTDFRTTPGALQTSYQGGVYDAFVAKISPATTTTALGSSANPSIFGQSVTFTATVSSTASGTPTGTVTFSDGSTTLGTETLNGSAQATFTTSSLTVGSHSVRAQYSGDGNFSGSISASTLLAVTAPAVTLSSASLSFGNQQVWYHKRRADGNLNQQRKRGSEYRGHCNQHRVYTE
jgi:hypothetical protein